MSKVKIDGTVKVRIYNYVDDRMDVAIGYGYRRAHKHTDAPTEEQVTNEIHLAVMNELCEIFNFGE